MKIRNSNKPLKGNPDLLVVVLTTNKNLDAAGAFIRKNYARDAKLKRSVSESGATELIFTSRYKVAVLGLGRDPKLEGFRDAVHNAVSFCNDFKVRKMAIALPGLETEDRLTAVTETAMLSNYQFLNYKSDNKGNALKETVILTENREHAAAVKKGILIGNVTSMTRDLVNEPLITLTATELGKRAVEAGKEYGFKTEVFNKKKIETLKMGGILAVNFGSPEPPTFTIMEWKPKNAKNKKPIVLVGKGVVFDTGGVSLKPTANSMDFMKADMAGGAAVIGAMSGIAGLELPYHVIGLVPATDNRPGQNAYVPGDVIKMFDGSTVEVLNTDAEGRMLLADALAYAKKYDPELVIDLATLTGAAVISIGTQGIAMMTTAGDKVNNALKASGMKVHERCAELPLWDEYGDQLKSDIADLKNIGGRAAGSITAGKFLQHFTDYPWVHLDIAGGAFLHAADGYRGKNGTGLGTRLLIDFVANYEEEEEAQA